MITHGPPYGIRDELIEEKGRSRKVGCEERFLMLLPRDVNGYPYIFMQDSLYPAEHVLCAIRYGIGNFFGFINVSVFR